MKRITLSLLFLALMVPAAGAARSVREKGVESICATRVSTTAISYARHKFNQRRLARQSGDRLVVGQPGVRQGVMVTEEKNIAVIADDGTIFPPPNLFDMSGAGVQYRFRRRGKIRARRFLAGVSPERGNRIQIGDDANRRIRLPFDFTFYGTTYDRVWLNSDGNLTFTEGESSSTPRSIGRFLEGPPRIAINFVDLDPGVTSGEAGVYLLRREDMVRITWVDVPEWGASNRNTMQLTLYPTGRITMGYGNVDATDGIIGLSPGGPGGLELIDMSRELPESVRDTAIAEQFRAEPEIDDLAASRAVLSTVVDDYDLIVLFADFQIDLGDAFAYNAPVSNEILGIGDITYDFTNVYGSDGRLRAFVQMGSLRKYPSAPDNNIGLSEATGIGILAHEVGHRWLAYPTFINDQGRRSTDLLGRQLAHWSFNLDTDGSVMEGNDIRDNGNGTFTTVGSWQGFSPLDEYLMGFRKASRVQPFFYVSGSAQDNSSGPDTGVTLTGQRVDVTIAQVIAAIGPRVPERTTEPTQVAFALLARDGESPSLASIDKVNRYRKRLESFFPEQTGNNGVIETRLRLKEGAVVEPAAAGAGALEPASAGPAAVEPAATPPAMTADPERLRDEPRERFDRVAERR